MAKSDLRERVQALGLHGILARWDELGTQPWLATLIEVEEHERKRRSLERRVHNAKLGSFKSIADFEWDWPKKIDRDLVQEVLGLGFLGEAANVVLLGPNGVGKTTLAKNIAHQAILAGHTVLCITASEMLNDLAAQEGSTALARRLRRYTRPQLLLIDEVGYLSYDSRHGDLLFEIISKRHQEKSIVLTTNKIFSEWNETFSNSSCITAMVDRLVHHAEIISIEGESYRAKEARERVQRRRKKATRKKPGQSS